MRFESLIRLKARACILADLEHCGQESAMCPPDYSKGDHSVARFSPLGLSKEQR